MTKESSSQCHYSFTPDLESQSYKFTTKNNIVYNVAFVDGSNSYSDSSNLDKVFYITIDSNHNTPPKDYKVRLTIEAILKAFFNRNEQVLLFICDAADNKQLVRHGLFNRWYNASELKDEVLKIDNTFDDGVNTQYTSILYHINHPYKEELETVHEQIVIGLTEGK